MEKPRTLKEENAFVFNRTEYLVMGLFTEQELDNADEKGFIGKKYGYDYYVSRLIPVKFENV